MLEQKEVFGLPIGFGGDDKLLQLLCAGIEGYLYSSDFIGADHELLYFEGIIGNITDHEGDCARFYPFDLKVTVEVGDAAFGLPLNHDFGSDEGLFIATVDYGTFYGTTFVLVGLCCIGNNGGEQ
ncbi:Uncharacterised protein [Chlamydia trachomatis]|nr:Uncharacterised protein [Chlamydia trachomatis]